MRDRAAVEDGFEVFDSHCHIDPEVFGGETGADDVVRTAQHAGVTRMLTVGAGYGDGTAQRAVAVAARHEGVWASVGVHPHDASTLDEAALEGLKALCQHPKVVALGEMGLDFYYDHSPRDIQREAFRQQIALALALNLPIIIHDRDSGGETLSILKAEGAFEGAGVLYHCYSGTVAEAHQILDHGGVLSIPGVVTFKRSDEMREVVRQAPLERILVETDAPFLTPEPLRGRKNEPAHVALVLEAVAQIKGVPLADMAAITTANACRFFRV